MRLFSYVFLILGLFSFSGCLDLEFDEPPVTGGALEFTGNTSIADLKALSDPNEIVEIKDDIIIQGVVVADDRSGNFFREFVMQDETGGLKVLINLTSLYNFFPIGREVAIKCQGLFLEVDEGVIQLGGYLYQENGADRMGDIIDYNTRIARGMIVGEPEPKVRKINELTINDINTLIKIEDVEFAAEELGQSFADPIGNRSINRILNACEGGSIILRSSGFADFAGEPLPGGNGDVVAIYSVFRDDAQLFIRELTDLTLADTSRCTGGSATGNELVMPISEVRDIYQGTVTSAPNDRKIKGVVISDKDNGNITGRNLVIQDETAGIVIRFEDDHNFALNEEIEVLISGQELSEFNGLLQVNNVPNDFATSNGIVASPTPRTATVQEVSDNQEAWESTLVLLENVTISGSNTFNGSTTVTDASGSIDMFTRSAASFASTPLPTGTVGMTAIVSEFNAPQVGIRNLDDIDGEIVDPGGGNELLMTIQEVRDLFGAGEAVAPADRKIQGIVISDKDNGNITDRNVVIQDETAGIVVRFGSAHDLPIGASVEVVISNLELSEFSGLLQVNNVPLGNASNLGAGSLPTPRTATVQEILDNQEAWESTLVLIENASISGNATFDGENTVTDASGASIALFTRSGAIFASEPLPAEAVNLAAIVSEFDAPQLIMRNIQDLEGGQMTGGGDPRDGITEDFSSYMDDEDIMKEGWLNVAVKGTRVWRAQEFGGNLYAQATAFNDSNPEMETWLVLPVVDFSTPKVLSFESAQAFYTHDGLSVLISTDFDGTNITSATWTELEDAVLAGSDSDDNAWVPSGEVDLSGFFGNGYIAFRHIGNNASGTTSYRIDNIVVQDK